MRENRANRPVRKLRAVCAAALAAALILTVCIPLAACSKEEPIPVKEGWTLVWNDEFSGKELDSTKWAPQTGTGEQYGLDAWGNNEQEYYTADNISVKDGNLILEARADTSYGTGYTSGRIRTVTDTESLFSFTYGYVEARIKLPKGDGLWPAFWMLPTESPYGTWARSGEIDIMEARGRITGEIGGALHYGDAWPNNYYSGDEYRFGRGQSITDYHVYAVEWIPGKITWFVDGEEFYSFNDWESVDCEWPAPFDVDFHLLLNLAVGGNFDGGIMPQADELPAQMLVDYVRVYSLDGGYDYNVEKPVKPVPVIDKAAYDEYSKMADESGDYIKDKDFAALDTTCITSSTQLPIETGRWNFLALAEFGGKASASVTDVNGVPMATVDISDVGTQDYAVQLIQYVPLAHNAEYKVTFDAKADSARTIVSKVSGDDNNSWTVYSRLETFDLTTEVQTFSYTFLMEALSDPTARLEFELGLADPTVYIGNVSICAVTE